MKPLCGYLLALLLFYFPAKAWAQPNKILKTQYTTVYFSQDSDLNDFLWRLGGKRLEVSSDIQLAQNRIDRLVNRVQLILDMWPNELKFFIYLERGALEFNKTAYYNEPAKAIHISVDYTSDGVLAHEIAHVIISQYFPSPVPSKVKEILCQYVDKNLWSDY